MSARSAVGVSLMIAVVALVGCSSSKNGASSGSATSTTAVSTSSAAPSTTRPTASTAAAPVAARPVCGNPGTPPARYQAVVVFSFENRTWSDVGTGFSKMPYLHSLAQRCTYFPDWTETDTKQSSLTQYVGEVTGARQSGTVFDCSPSDRCSTTADNIFRQGRVAGVKAVNYVEGATKGCDASGNAVRHVPDMYMWSADDRAACETQTRPYSEFDPNHPAGFAFITPTLCNDGHDCANDVVDRWARANIQPVLASAAYRAGKVAVFVWYDEDHPVPNLWIAPTANAGANALAGAGYAGTLSAWESMLGLPCLANACTAPNMRAAANA